MKRLSGQQLKKALEEKNISTAGLPVTNLGTPTESAMQSVLAEHLRDERDERLTTATSNLADFTKKLVWATWAVAFASAALVIATVVQIVVTLGLRHR